MMNRVERLAFDNLIEAAGRSLIYLVQLGRGDGLTAKQLSTALAVARQIQEAREK